MKRIVLALACFVLVGCQAMIYGTASDFNKLRPGMTKDEVLKVLGEPVSTEADGPLEALVYKRMQHAISDWPRIYVVTLQDGQLVRYGERATRSSGGRVVSGSAIQIMPGVTHYNFQSSGDDNAEQAEREAETQRRLERIERHLERKPDERRMLDMIER